MQPTTNRKQPRALLITLLAIALVFTLWAWQTSHSQADSNTDDFVTQLCEGSLDC